MFQGPKITTGTILLACVLGVASVGVPLILHHHEMEVYAAVGPIAIAAFIGGRALGLLATLLAGIAFAWMFPDAASRAVMVIIDGVFMSVLVATLQRMRERAEQTEREERRAVERSRSQFQQMFALLPIPAVLGRASDLKLVAVNDAFLSWAHISEADVDGVLAQQTLLSADALASVHAAAVAGRCEGLEVTATVAGEERTVLVSMNPLLMDGESFVISAIQDVTELRRSEARFVSAFRENPLPSGIVRLTDRTVVDVNEAFVRRFHVSRSDVAGGRSDDALHFVDQAQRLRLRDELATKGRIDEQEVQIRTPKGELVDALLSGQVFADRAGPCALLVLQDITDRKRKDAELLASRERFATAFRSNPLPTMLVRLSDNRYLDVNDRFIELFGYPREEVVGAPFGEIVFFNQPLDLKRLRDEVLTKGYAHDIGVVLRTRTGGRVDALWSSELVEIDGQRCLLSVIQDVTERRVQEQQIRASETRFQTVFRLNPLPAAISSASDFRVIDVNEAYLRVFGFERDEVVGTSHNHGFANAVDRAAMLEQFARDGRVMAREVHLVTKQGAPIEALWSMEFVDMAGERCLLTVIQDITELKRHEVALQASEARFSRAFTSNPLPAMIMRLRDHSCMLVNTAFSQAFGYSCTDLVGRNTAEAGLYDDPDVCVAADKELQARGTLREFPLSTRTKVGDLRDQLVSAELIEINGESCSICVFEDVTERNRTMALLRESEGRFRSLAENIQDVFWVTASDGRTLTYVSPAYESIWGRTCESLYESSSQWVDCIVEEDRERVLQAATMDGTNEYREEYRIRRSDGSIRWISDRGAKVLDENGHVRRHVGVAKDVTEYKALETQLRQTQKMESLGMLAGGVAHDFNNVLAVIASCAGLLSEAIPPSDENHDLVTEIDQAVQRATSLTRQLLAFSRKQVTEPRNVDVNAAVNETRKLLRRMVGEDVLLSVSLHPELGVVRIDPGNLVQVLMNLAVNARDAMPLGGTLSLVTRETVVSPEQIRAFPQARPGRAVLLEVADTGSGMPEAVRVRIFEPFFTTKQVGKGTGMGLAVVHGIVEQAGGFITVDSELGVGTTFRIYLPVVSGPAMSADQMTNAVAMGNETVLIVDDDDHVRRVAARALRARGYRVVEASDGPSALALMAGLAKLDLLLTDVVMPGMDGRQLVEAARARMPSLRVLYTSGYTDDAVVRRGVQRGEIELLEKPFRVDCLATKVRHVLDNPAVRPPKAA